LLYPLCVIQFVTYCKNMVLHDLIHFLIRMVTRMLMTRDEWDDVYDNSITGGRQTSRNDV